MFMIEISAWLVRKLQNLRNDRFYPHSKHVWESLSSKCAQSNGYGAAQVVNAHLTERDKSR